MIRPLMLTARVTPASNYGRHICFVDRRQNLPLMGWDGVWSPGLSLVCRDLPARLPLLTY